MQDVPQDEDWEREDLSEGEQEEFVGRLAGLIQLSTMAQYNMYAFFETVPPEIRGAVYEAAMAESAQRMKGQTHQAPRSIQ